MDIKNLKPHFFFMITLLTIIILFNIGLFREPNLFSTKCLPTGDSRADHIPGNFNIKESYFKYHQVPLWTHHRMSGTPFLAIGTKPVFYPPFLLFLILFDYGGATNFTMIFNLILAAIGTYFLAYYLTKNRYASFISALIYTFCGYTTAWNFNLVEGWAIPYLPFIVLFTLKAFSKKEWIKYSILTSVCIALMFHSGSTVTSLYGILLFGYVLIFKLFGSSLKKRLIKVILIGLIVSLISFGLIAVKLLPSLGFFKITNRNEPYTFERSRGGVLENPVDAFKQLFKGGKSGGDRSAYVGIVAFFLTLFSLLNIKKKNVIFFLAISIITILIVSPIPVYYVLWKFVPMFNKQKNIARMLIIFCLGIAMLSAYGSIILFNFIKKKFKYKNAAKIAFAILSFFIILDLNVFMIYGFEYFRPLEECDAMFKDSEGLQYIAEDKDIFRIKVNEINGIDWSIAGTTRAAGIETMYSGFGALWVPEYLNVHMAVALSSPAKLWGMLNAKYLTSLTPLNITGFELVGTFRNCTICYPAHAGPKYVYINKKYLPRAHIVNYSVFIAGDIEAVKQIAYALILNGNYNPVDMVIVLGEKGLISNYNIDFLKNFNAIVLTRNSIDEKSQVILKEYINSGGILIPNILEGKNQITDEDINNILRLSNKSYDKVNKADIAYYSTNKIKIKLNKNNGFLVFAETFPIFKGWYAKMDSKKTDILRANGITAAVPINENNSEIEFYYKPKGYVRGLYITISTIALIVIYFSYISLTKYKRETIDKQS